MKLQRTSLSKLCLLTITLLAPIVLTAQTTINVNSTVIQPAVKRFGINLGEHDFYDSGQMLKNLVYTNSSFEGEIYQSTVRCASGTANSCTDDNIYSGWPTSFWTNASYQMISGTSVGRSGSICSYVGATYPTSGGTFTFCDSNGAVPANGDYMVVKINMPTNVGWPSGDWQTAVGNGTLTAETYDMPAGTTGKQSALLTAPTASDSIALNMFFDSTIGKTFLQLNGSYQLSFKAKGVAGSKSIAIALNRAGAGLTYINQTQALTSSWAPYTINFNASENGSAIGRVELSFTTSGADTVELDDVSLVKTGTDPTNTTVFRDEVVNTLKALHPGVIRDWQDQLGESLDNMLADPLGRQRTAYTPYNGFDSTDVYFQTQSVEYGLTDFLQLCQLVGADPWIVVPSTFSTSEAYNLIDYLAGSSSTTYGAKRAAAGQTQPWTSVFGQIHLEFGNEEWNGGTFKGGAIEYAASYGQRATAIFAAMLGNASFSAPSFDLIVNGQSAAPGRNMDIQTATKNNNSFSIAPYMMYNITQFDTTDHLFGTTFAEAEAFVTPNSSSENVTGGYITTEQQMVGKPIVTSEMNLSPSSGSITQSVLNGYASSVGGGIAVLDSMFQQLRAGVLTQNLFELPGYSSNTVQTPSNTMYLWGAVLDMGVTNRVRPQYLALQLANSAIGSSTQMLQTVHTGADPTDTQYGYGLNTVTLPTFHYLQSFAFTGNGSNSLVVFNVNPDYAEQVNFGGSYAPTGTVVMQRLTSANITDTNELANVVSNTSTTLSNFNPSSTITLPPYSMTVFTWGGTVQSAPVISSVTATNITSNSATITWTTDEAASSQVSYGTSPSYGSLTAVNSTLSTTHTVNLTGLTAGTTYDYAAISANSSSASTTSGNFTFATTSAAPVITAVTATAITSTSATITWTTDQAASSQVSYGATSAYGSLSAVNSALSTTHSVTLTGLTAGTTYDYAAISANTASQSTTSGNFTFSTNTVAPVITAVTASSITATSATITWTTDQAASSQVSYGITSAYGSLTTVNSTLSNTHTVMLTGLMPGTTYDYAAISANAASQSTTSGNFTFATIAAASPVISAVSATNITSTGATITWTTDQAASSQVKYGTTNAYGSLSTLNSALSTSHSVTLTGLTPGTTYDYAAVSANSSSVSATSGNFTFATTSVAPVLSAVTATGISSTSATITWTTDQAASSQVSYGTTSTYGSLSPVISALSTTHTVTLTGLMPGTTYDYAAISANAASQSTTSGNFTFATTAAAAPVISAVTATGITTTSATITWTTDQAASSQVKYGTTSAYGSASTLNSALSTTHSVTLTGLTAGTTYNYAAISANSSSVSATSGNFTFTTTSVAPVITAVTATAITTTSATISWTTDQAASSQVAYGATAAYGSLSPVISSLSTTHSVTLTGLTAGTTYNYAAISANSASQSTTSGNFTFTTTTASATPPYVGYVAFWGITNSGVTISWSTDVLANTELAYGTTTALGQLTPVQTALTASHGVVLTGLTSGTTYYFVAESTGANGATGYSTTYSFTTYGTAPSSPAPVISAVTSTGITSTSVTINWTTDQASSSQVNYGTTLSYGSSSLLNASLQTTHSVTLTGLTPGTTYDYQVISTNSSSTTGTSSNYTFTTSAAAPAPPVISNIQTTAITSSSVTVTWTTDQAANSEVNYGLTTSYGSSTGPDSSFVTSHSVTLTGLTAGTTYNFDVVSANAASLSSTSGNNTIATTAANAKAPYVGYVAFWGVNNSGVTISWSTDVLANTQLAYGTTTALGQMTTLQTTLAASHGVALTGLTSGTTYYFVAESTGSNGVTGYSTTYSFTTTGTAPVNPAPVISAVTVTNITNTSATISWTTDQASSSLVNYGVTSSYTSSSALSSSLVTAHSVTLTGLTLGTTYDFDVVSANSSGTSATSANTTFTTTGSAPVPVISAVSSSNVTSGTATITWTTDQAASSQVNYGLTTAYGSSSALVSTLVTSHSVILTGLTPDTKYNFDVFSANAANTPVTSGNYTFTTQAASATPPAVSNVAFWGVTSSGVIISWSTDVMSNTAVAYGTTTALGQLTPVQTALSDSHGVTLTGLAASTTYYFVAQSADSGGNTGYSTTYTFTTLAGPPIISSIVATPAAGNVATISWTTSVPTTSYVQYGTSSGNYNRYSAQTNLTSTPVCTLSYVPSGKVYYQVVSTNASGAQVVSPEATFTEP